jgi:hypothetical protein
VKDKIHQLNEAIRAKAAELGLVFTNGPAPECASFEISGENKVTFGFTVAQK